MAPVMMHINANVLLILILKWILKAMKNMNNPEIPIRWMLALNLANANTRQVRVDINIPKKK